ncbi:ammonium transporter [Streptacidiphilus sp. EB129]|uniref:ammonium transporter n=1 Tax=Streptacidiphilus sp. EB129 TaxID=3156262 RepID=UPI0035160079
MKFDFAHVDTGSTAWVLVSAALVLFMTPGVAFFYGGMVRTKHVMSMLLQNFITIALVSVVWVVLGYCLAFGKGNGFIGDLHFAGLAHMDETVPGFTGASAMAIPPLVYVIYQMMFAVITPSLITGATADRWRFASFVPFVVLWSLLVYSPVAHWIFSPVGWAAKLGVLDFAGGIVVHTTAGAAALVMAIVLGRRRGWPGRSMPQSNLPLMLVGAAILWFGWFGFNGGSALGANQLAASAFINTNTAGAAALLAWLVVERLRQGRATTLGAAAGAVAGLAAVTPCAGYVSPLGALAIGAAAGVLCAFAVEWKHRLGYDDALDVVGVHLVGGVFGALAVGLFATKSVNAAGANGLFYGGGLAQLGKQAIGVGAAFGYTVVVTLVIALFLKWVTGNRVSAQEEELGLDLSLHGERAYSFAESPDPAEQIEPGGESGGESVDESQPVGF